MVEMGGGFWCGLTHVFPHKQVKIRPFLLTDTPSYLIAFCYDGGVSNKRESTVVSSKSTSSQLPSQAQSPGTSRQLIEPRLA